MARPKSTEAAPLETLAGESRRPKKVFVPHTPVDAPIAPPPSDTEIAREPMSSEATWHAGPERDPQLDPVDAINPVNPANPAGPISEPVTIQDLDKEQSGISMGLVIGILVVAIAIAVFWFSAVDFNVMGGPTPSN